MLCDRLGDLVIKHNDGQSMSASSSSHTEYDPIYCSTESAKTIPVRLGWKIARERLLHLWLSRVKYRLCEAPTLFELEGVW